MSQNQPESQLTLEQEFSLRAFQDQVLKMNLHQAQDFLIYLYERMLIRETAYRTIIKNK